MRAGKLKKGVIIMCRYAYGEATTIFLDGIYGKAKDAEKTAEQTYKRVEDALKRVTTPTDLSVFRNYVSNVAKEIEKVVDQMEDQIVEFACDQDVPCDDMAAGLGEAAKQVRKVAFAQFNLVEIMGKLSEKQEEFYGPG